MLVVRVELWPLGSETNKRTLGTAYIANDGTGTAAKGSYDVSIYSKGGKRLRTTKVVGFPRKRLLAWDLLCRALMLTFGDRNMDEIVKAAKKQLPKT